MGRCAVCQASFPSTGNGDRFTRDSPDCSSQPPAPPESETCPRGSLAQQVHQDPRYWSSWWKTKKALQRTHEGGGRCSWGRTWWFWGYLAQDIKDNLIHFASPAPDRGAADLERKMTKCLESWNKSWGVAVRTEAKESLPEWRGKGTRAEYPQRSTILSLNAQITPGISSPLP